MITIRTLFLQPTHQKDTPSKTKRHINRVDPYIKTGYNINLTLKQKTPPPISDPLQSK